MSATLERTAIVVLITQRLDASHERGNRIKVTYNAMIQPWKYEDHRIDLRRTFPIHLDGRESFDEVRYM